MSDFSPEVPQNTILVLALGNDVMGDDAIALHAARELRSLFPSGVTIREAAVGGFELLELMEGYGHALIIDAIVAGSPPGTIHLLSPDNFRTVVAGSPHYVGLPEVLQLAERLGIPFPADIRILAVDVRDPYEIRESLSPEAAAALPAIIGKASSILREWLITPQQTAS